MVCCAKFFSRLPAVLGADVDNGIGVLPPPSSSAVFSCCLSGIQSIFESILKYKPLFPVSMLRGNVAVLPVEMVLHAAKVEKIY